MVLGSGIFQPSPGINYDFVTISYAIASFVCILLAIASLVFEVDSVKGWYICLVPFPPCLLWSLIVRRNWRVAEAAAKKELKKE